MIFLTHNLPSHNRFHIYYFYYLSVIFFPLSCCIFWCNFFFLPTSVSKAVDCPKIPIFSEATNWKSFLVNKFIKFYNNWLFNKFFFFVCLNFFLFFSHNEIFMISFDVCCCLFFFAAFFCIIFFSAFNFVVFFSKFLL